MEEEVIHIIDIPGNWLTNDELQICLIKSQPPDKLYYSTDISRPESIKLLRNLFTVPSTRARINEVSLNNPCLILASELAFSSQDYDEIKDILKSQASKFIFIGGFGFTTGKGLKQLVSPGEVHACWNEDLIDDAKYNCGWIWVGDGKNLTCYVFLKTFIDQTHEIPFNITQGKSTVRLQTADLILFPLICSELLCALPINPRKKIVDSLQANPPNNRKVLVTVSSYEVKPSSSHWQSSIGNLVNNTHEIRLLMCNCFQPEPNESERIDQWRCLSGAYQKIGIMKDAPPVPLPHIRFVRDSQFDGLILRNSNFGIAAGRMSWGRDGSTSKNVITIDFRDKWDGTALSKYDSTASFEEIFRTIRRYKKKILTLGDIGTAPLGLSYDEEVKGFTKEFSSSPKDKEISSFELLRKMLFGIERIEEINFDKLNDDHLLSFSRGLLSLLLIKKSLGIDLPSLEITYGQLLADALEQEILVWKSPIHPANKMITMLESLALEGGSARVLTVVGEGSGFGDSSSQKIQTRRGTDYTNRKDEERSITQTRDRVIYWQKMGEVETVYSLKGDINELRKQIQIFFEKITTV